MRKKNLKKKSKKRRQESIAFLFPEFLRLQFKQVLATLFHVAREFRSPVPRTFFFCCTDDNTNVETVCLSGSSNGYLTSKGHISVRNPHFPLIVEGACCSCNRNKQGRKKIVTHLFFAGDGSRRGLKVFQVYSPGWGWAEQ